MHPGYQVEMIPHNCETQHVNKVKPAQSFDKPQQIILVSILNWQACQSCTGYDVIDGLTVTADETSYAGHEIPPLRLVVELLEEWIA